MPHPSFISPPSPPHGRGPGSPMSFSSEDGTGPYFPERNYTISGVTRDASGAALAGCEVNLYNTANDVLTQTVISAADGSFAFVVDKTLRWYIVSYLAGSPDVVGTTVNTLAGA